MFSIISGNIRFYIEEETLFISGNKIFHEKFPGIYSKRSKYKNKKDI